MKYFKDFRGYLFLGLWFFKIYLMRWISTFLVRMIFFLKGIKLGHGNVFYGIPITHRVPFASIRIGNNNSFRSEESSNPAGLNHRCVLYTNSKDAIIQIGNNSGFSGVTIAAEKKITIGNNVLCGANSVITDTDWHETILFSSSPEPVIIHDHVWLGLNTVVLKGVEIGKNSVIGANSVVVKDIPENVIAAGNPCRVIKQITLQNSD